MKKQFNIIKLIKIAHVLSLVFLFVSVVARLYVSTAMTIKNDELKNATLEKLKLEKEVSYLKNINADYSRIQNVETRAKQLGFVEFKDKILSVNPSSLSHVASVRTSNEQRAL